MQRHYLDSALQTFGGVMTIMLVALFFATALLYASVGFGGGSTYNALLVLHGADYRILPSIALLCNIIVAAGGVWRFSRAGHIPLKRLAPFVAASIPAAWIGGRIPISETVFIGLLGFALLAAGLRLVLKSGADEFRDPVLRQTSASLAALIGGSIGLLAGLVGIGGGIFLAPILYALHWGTPRDIAGASSFFIFANSLSGLAGQLVKLEDLGLAAAFVNYWPLFAAVLVGGQIGSRLGSAGLDPGIVKRLTGVLILYVAARLLLRWFAIVS